MQPPPPFEMPGGMPKKAKSPWPWIIVGGVLLCCVAPIAVIGGGAYWGFKNVSPLVGCTMSLTGISSGLSDYAKANGGKLPPAATWQNDIASYYEKGLPKEDMGPFSVPSAKEPLGCGDAGSKTAFAFNSELGGKKLADLTDAEKAIVVFEMPGAPAVNKSAPYKDPGKAASPKIFGESRGWFAINGELEPVSVVDGRQGPMNTGTRRRSRGSN